MINICTATIMPSQPNSFDDPSVSIDSSLAFNLPTTIMHSARSRNEQRIDSQAVHARSICTVHTSMAAACRPVLKIETSVCVVVSETSMASWRAHRSSIRARNQRPQVAINLQNEVLYAVRACVCSLGEEDNARAMREQSEPVAGQERTLVPWWVFSTPEAHPPIPSLLFYSYLSIHDPSTGWIYMCRK